MACTAVVKPWEATMAPSDNNPMSTAQARIIVNRRDTATALDGDRVLVSLAKPNPRR